MIRLFYLDYRATLRERKVLVAAALFAYAVAAVPALFAKPPAHMIAAAEGWFGTSDRFALFLYMWTDLAMNKLAAVLAVVVAGGIVARERDAGSLAVLLSKPITHARYFLVRLASSWAVLATLYVGAHVAGAAVFHRTVEGFRAGPFFASMSLHLFTLLFSAALAAMIGVIVKRRALAMIASFLILASLMGASFAGFYQPAWQAASLANPFTLGVQVLAHVGALSPAHVLAPMGALVALTILVAAGGAIAARRVEV